MLAKDPPEVVELFERIAELLSRAVVFNGTIVRSAGTLYASEDDFLSGHGASERGGRWNRPGMLAVYGSLDILTATHEAYQNFIDAGFPLSAIRPRVMAAAKATLRVVFDLTELPNRRKIGFTQAELVEEDWQGIQAGGEESWTQAIARGCRTAGFEALIVPSARRRIGKNIVVFPTVCALGAGWRPLPSRSYRLIRTRGPINMHFCRYCCLYNCFQDDNMNQVS